MFRAPPAAVIEELPNLSAAAQRVVMALCCFMSRNGGCWPKQTTIMKRVGIKRPETVRRGLRELEGAGLLRVSRQRYSCLYQWSDGRKDRVSERVRKAVWGGLRSTEKPAPRSTERPSLVNSTQEQKPRTSSSWTGALSEVLKLLGLRGGEEDSFVEAAKGWTARQRQTTTDLLSRAVKDHGPHTVALALHDLADTEWPAIHDPAGFVSSKIERAANSGSKPSASSMCCRECAVLSEEQERKDAEAEAERKRQRLEKEKVRAAVEAEQTTRREANDVACLLAFGLRLYLAQIHARTLPPALPPADPWNLLAQIVPESALGDWDALAAMWGPDASPGVREWCTKGRSYARVIHDPASSESDRQRCRAGYRALFDRKPTRPETMPR